MSSRSRASSSALAPRRQRDHDHAGVDLLAAAEGRDAQHDALDLAAADARQDAAFDLRGVALGVLEARALGTGGAHEEHAAVLGGRHLGGHRPQQQPRGRAGEHEHAEREPRMRQHPAERAAVGRRHARLPRGGRGPGVRGAGEQPGREHGRQRQRDEARAQHRARQRQGKLAEQPSDVALEQRERGEGGDQHHGRRHDREAHLARAAEGGQQRRLAQLAAAVDVLHDHDGIVHHQPHGEHQREQGEDVHREAERLEQDERGHQRDRHGERRDERRARAAQEGEDHRDHRQRGVAQRPHHLVDRGLDELRRVEVHRQRHALRQRGPDALHLGTHGPRRGQRVRLGLLDDPEPQGRPAVGAELAAQLHGPDLDLGDLAEPHGIAAGCARDHQAGEVLRGAELPARAQRELALLRLQPPRGPLGVLLLQRALDVLGGEAARGQRQAVQPDAHGEAPLPAQAHLRDALEVGEAVHEVALGVVRELEPVHPVAGEHEPEDRRGVGVGLGDLRRVGLLGQLAERAADAVAHVVGGVVDVARELELDADGGAAVAAARGDLAHALDAGGAVLEDLRDAGLDHRGGGAGVVGVDRDHRRVDVRILAHRGRGERGQAEDHQQQV
jgi:hypothetical protein